METNQVLLILGAVVVAVLYFQYVSVIKKKNKAQEAFSSIDVQLKKRYDLIPNILTVAAKFMEHEKTLLSEVTELRTQAMNLGKKFSDINQKINLDAQIAQKMGQIMVAVENYPDLKSDVTMVQAMQTYNEVEEHIAAARRFYNSAAKELKDAVEIFPSSFIASMLNIQAVDFIEAQEHEKQSINAADYLK